ncbi:uncharacterized protein LOC123298425 [Chrysoperla carnea]|uniref:uncharacterized protein LOC123298425 n=1 Tax=Chrysoperla carnea TaxID=189513 RepID=UPI001D094972|nr:uncharacterized protein LOC123298425 [Chrysoperla carnea]
MRSLSVFALTLTITLALLCVNAAPKPGLLQNVAHGIGGAVKGVGNTLGLNKVFNKKVQKIAKKEVQKVLHALNINISDKTIDAIFDPVIKLLSQLTDEQLADITKVAKAVLKFLKENNISISLEDIKKYMDILAKALSNIETAIKSESLKAAQQSNNAIDITSESPKAVEQIE